MGSPQSEFGSNENERPQRTVTVGSFMLARTEVTQRQWMAVMGSNPSRFKGCDDCPVENVSWNDAKEYIRRLNQRTGQSYRLPTEAEWEYAARAGTTTPFSTGHTITTDQANFDGTETYNGSSRGQYRQRTTPVGSFPVNRWGLADMHGNVWEWVGDCVGSYRGAPSDARPVTTGDCSLRVRRGGGWDSIPQWLRSAFRIRFSPEFRNSGSGFRLARTLP